MKYFTSKTKIGISEEKKTPNHPIQLNFVNPLCSVCKYDIIRTLDFSDI